MSGRKHQKKGTGKKFKAAGTAATAAGRLKGKKKPPPPPTNNRKVILIVLGLLLLIAAIVGIVLAINNQDDFETTQEQFDSSLQIQGDDKGLVEWEPEYSDVHSEKALKLINAVKATLSGALAAEGINAEEIEITKLSPAPPVTFTRTEEVRTRGRRDQQGRAEFQQKTYTDVSFVDVSYKTYAKPEKNAASFGTAKEEDWDQVGKMVSTRMGSAGLQTELQDFKPKASFSDAVQRAVGKHAYEITTAAPEAQESVVCDCEMSAFGKVSKENPSIVCDCYEGCTGTTRRVVHGGVDDVFSIKTAICPAARYAEITTDDGGYVEVVFSGFQTVRSGPDKFINGFEMNPAEYYMNAVTLKSLGSVIKATNPPTTADPSIGGFFRVRTTTLNPYVKPNPGRQFVRKLANPPIVLAVHVQNLDGQAIDYGSLLELKGQAPQEQDQKSQEIQDLMDRLKVRVATALSGLPIDNLEVEITGLDQPPDEANGLVAKVGLVGNVSDSVTAVTEAEKGGLVLRTQVERGITSLGELVMIRFSADLLAELRAFDEKQLKKNTRTKRSALRRLTGSSRRILERSFRVSKRIE